MQVVISDIIMSVSLETASLFHAPEKLEYLERETHALWTTLEDCLCHESENKSSTRVACQL